MNKYQEALDIIVENSCPQKVPCGKCTISKVCNCDLKWYINRLQELVDNQFKYRWHYIVDEPTDTPDKYNCDWVLAQIVEDNGFAWMPKLAEFRAAKDDWYCDDAAGWLNDSNGLFKVVAWCELPTNDWSDSND